ncbi:MAG TPA: mercuric reductase [Ktedonobacterales bacterium]
MAIETYDAIVIGSGQAGGPLSTALANAGRRTALIEREHVGGTCINEGCTPTKTMVASARVAYLARRAADYGIATGPVTVDMLKVRQRKREIVVSFREGSERHLLAAPNLDLVSGEATFTGPSAVRVTLPDGATREMTAPTIIINAGERPAPLKIPGVESVPLLNSTSIMELDVVPSHLIVVGGGYVGLEFAQMFRRFGSQVTLVHRGKHLLAREDDDVADEVAKILHEDGVDVLLEAAPSQLARLASGEIAVTVVGGGTTRTLTGSHVLIAAGRMPNTDALNTAAAGLVLDERGYIKTNERLETNVAGIYALGDVKGGPAFTHISYDDFRILRTNLLEGGNASITNRLVPYTVYIDPQLGRVGMNELEAAASGRSFRVAKMPMSYVARADEVDETRGLMKAIVDPETKQILGATVLGIEGGELMSMFEIAMIGRVPYTVLKEAIFAHPTLAESLNNLFAKLDR